MFQDVFARARPAANPVKVIFIDVAFLSLVLVWTDLSSCECAAFLLE
jgi:hypothetical protein